MFSCFLACIDITVHDVDFKLPPVTLSELSHPVIKRVFKDSSNKSALAQLLFLIDYSL